MTALDVLTFATGAVRGHRLRTGLSLLGVAVGVTSVVLLTSLGEGARDYVTGEFASLGSNLVIVIPGKAETTGFAPPVGGAPHDLTLDDAEALAHLRGVRRVSPTALGTATARASNLTREAVVLGATAEAQLVRHITMRTGSFIPAGQAERDRAVCVIGGTIERELFSGRNALGEMLRIGDERFRIVGIMAPLGMTLGMNLDDMIVIPVVRHLKMFNQTSLTRVLVEMGSHDDLPAARALVIDVLTRRHNEEDVTVVTQDSMLAAFSDLLTVLTAALAGIAAISLSVAGIGIMNVMLVSVSERTREIGLLKALGATSGQVLRLFLTEAATLSAVGGTTGLVVAALLTAIVRRMYPAFPMHAPSWAMPSALAVSLLVGLVFGALPARRAAKLDPIAALARR